MSRKLQDFIKLLNTKINNREDLEMGSFVTWLRKRNPILRNLETKHVVEVIRNATHRTVKKDAILFKQGGYHASQDSLQFYILLRGSASLFNNPFMSQGKSSRRSSFSVERLLLSHSSEKPSLLPKSAASKSTATRLSPLIHSSVNEDIHDVENELSDDGNDVINEKEDDEKAKTDVEEQSGEGTTKDGNLNEKELQGRNSPASKTSKRSKVSVRSKLGNFVVKYEKGKYISEEAILNDDYQYTGSVIFDEDTDLMVLDETTFDKYIKEHHEKEAVDLTDYVDYHPFFRDLPIQSKGIIHISLKKQHHDAGKFIVKQGEPVKSLKFIVSGSAEVIIEPVKHRYQYPDYWPFETSTDVYYRECEWLRDSRRRAYQRSYGYHGEVSRRRLSRAKDFTKEMSVCSVLDKEVIGITEVTLNLGTYMQGYRCMENCEIYSLSLKPFRRILRRNGALKELVLAYIKMKLQFRMDNGLGEKVPLFSCLFNNFRAEIREKSYNGMVTRSIEKIKEREAELMAALDWFKQDKAPLVHNKDPGVIQLKENMKERARVRQSVLDSTNAKSYFRRGCLRAVKPNREPMSLHRLRNPMNEVLLRLRMAGTFIQTEEELEEILLRYSETPVERDDDISKQRQRVLDQEYNLFRYRRYGNQLVKKFSNMLQHGRVTRDQCVMSSALFQDETTDKDVNILRLESASNDEFERAFSRFTKQTARSYPSSYKTLQFDRRSVTPGTVEMRVKDFHHRCGGRSAEIQCLPGLARYDSENTDPGETPLPGGKVFVTKVPCVSCNRNIHLKNHTHQRYQMLHTLPMDKVKGYNRDRK